MVEMRNMKNCSYIVCAWCSQLTKSFQIILDLNGIEMTTFVHLGLLIIKGSYIKELTQSDGQFSILYIKLKWRQIQSAYPSMN